jgi:polysaccharide export outer membrane protein
MNGLNVRTQQAGSHVTAMLPGSRFAALILLTCLCALSAGCASYRPVVETPVDDLIRASAALEAGSYLIDVGDALTVKFYYHPELDFDVPVRSDGRISLSLIGELPATGRTTGQLSSDISAAYRSHLNQPDATVIMKSASGHRVFVTGEVNAPGAFVLQGNETALSVLSLAGGLSDRATYKKVVLIRRLPRSSMPMVTVLDLRKALNGSDTRQDVRIIANDIVYVPRTGSAQANVELKNLIWGKAPVYGTVGAGWTGVIK